MIGGLRLEPRAEPSRVMAVLAPLLAVALTLLFAMVLLAALGRSPMDGIRVFFLAPMSTLRGWSEIGLRMTPLLLCALGLALCYRANVWNIGAEGQLVVGGTLAGAVALLAGPETPGGFFVVVLLAGALGGLLWGALIAGLRDRFNANEILVSLMLTYVAEFLLMYLVHGPLKDPQGYNFPYSASFEVPALVPSLLPPTRLNVGFAIAIVLAVAMTLFMSKAFAGYRLQISGLAPGAARMAGFSPREGLWVALLVCGAFAGLAGALEVAGPLGQLTPSISPGYGFTAIIVAWLGRLHPVGCIAAAFVMSVVTIGGELAQSRLGLPNALGGVLQGLMLLCLLALDVLIEYRPRRRERHAEARASART